MQDMGYLRLLAKSNFILNDLQSLIGQPFPFYLDWSMCNAFNGATLADKTSTFQILFYPDFCDVRDSGSYSVFLKNMSVSIFKRCDSVSKISKERFKNEIIKSEKKYEQLEKEHGPQLINQISRIHLRATSISGLESSENNCNEFLRFISSHFHGTILPEPVYEEDWLATDLDLNIELDLIEKLTEREMEIIFDSPCQKLIIPSSIQDLFPNSEKNIFGFGKMVGFHSVKLLQKWGISSFHIFCRQF
ncbi:hypothetical protein Pan153_41890 [Gimesia panareensis]|uniref:Uncharacterized protein n=1 Tax=Gimesia panareensis TaxID=2527978 RepID=A0A518FT67_9PLAN|nr:hypothetical protein [Gimesia panareensis]QDV19523.1 hypothetical protein Pan153_41890 [Gimesia panareensis]